MGEAAKKDDDISSLDQLKAALGKLRDKAKSDIKKDSKATFSTQKAAGDVLEQVDSVTDAPKRAFAGAVQKTGSVKEGGKAAISQLLEGLPRLEGGRVRAGKVLESTPEFSGILEEDAVRRGHPRELARSGAKISGPILDLAAGAVGVGDAVAGAKVAGKAAKELKAFHEANSILDPEIGGIGRLAVESFDDKTMQKMKRMMEAQKREGLDAASARPELSKDVELETKSTDEGLGSILEGGAEKRMDALKKARAEGDRPGRSIKSVLEDLDVADKKLAKREGRTVDNPLSGRKAGKEDFGEGPADHQGKSKIPQRLSDPRKKNPDGFAEKILEEGDAQQGASMFLDNIPLYHSDAKGMRYELKGHGKKAYVEPLPEGKQKIFNRTKEADEANVGEIERLDSDYEKFTGEPRDTDPPLGDDLLDEAEKLGRRESYKARIGSKKAAPVGDTTTVKKGIGENTRFSPQVDKNGNLVRKSKHQGRSILDEEDAADVAESEWHKNDGIYADSASQKQREALRKLGYDKADSPHLTEDIADQIIQDFDDPKRFNRMMKKRPEPMSEAQAAYLRRKGVTSGLDETGKKEASELIGGFKEFEDRIKARRDSLAKDAQIKAQKERANAKPAVEEKKAVGAAEPAPQAEAKTPSFSRMTLETYMDNHFKPKDGESYGQALKRGREELRELKAKSKKPEK